MTCTMTRRTLDAILHAAKSTYPNEFIALLDGDAGRQLIDGLVILPAVFGDEHSLLRTDFLPPNQRTVGSIHSHPGFDNHPSPQDRQTFSELGPVHLIVCEPYTFESVAAYSARGNRIALRLA